MIYKWTPAEEALCKSLYLTKSYAEISQALLTARKPTTIKEFPALRSESAVRRKCIREGWLISQPINSAAAPVENTNVQDQWKLIYDLIEKHKSLSIKNTRGVMNVDQAIVKILSLSDIHFPLANTTFISQALSDHSDADIVVLNGDIIEGYIFSTFEKSRTVAAVDEYRIAFAFVEFLSTRFPKIILVDGNHDVRISRALSTAGFPKAATQIFRPNLLARIANGEKVNEKGELVEKVDFTNVLYQQEESWYVRVGKTLFIHPHGSGGGGPGAMVRKHAVRFNTRYLAGEIDSIVCGHTHQIYKGICNNQLLIEQGCLADYMAYSWGPRADYLSNAQNGYAVIYQDKDGNTDFNRSGPIYLGEIMPPKKSII